MTEPAIHHVAFACRDIDATVRFYDELMGMPLLHTEVSSEPRSGGFLRHFFFDAGDGSCLAFFDVHGVGEKRDWCQSLYFVDSNGIMVELSRDTPGLPIDREEAFSQLHAMPATPSSR
jgi:hypothetical protein